MSLFPDFNNFETFFLISLDKDLSVLLIFSKTQVLVLFLFSTFVFSWLKFMTAKDTICQTEKREMHGQESMEVRCMLPGFPSTSTEWVCYLQLQMERTGGLSKHLYTLEILLDPKEYLFM